jgi:hypothetical protein
MTQVARSLAAAALVALAGCGGGSSGREAQGTETGTAAAPADTAVSRDLKVAAVMIGKRIGQGNLITEPTFQFAPKDTVYLSVSTTGKPESATLSTKWRFQTGEVLDSSSTTIQPKGEDVTEFHLTRPKDWKVGTYSVTLYADGDSVDSKAFVVKK